MAEQKIELIGTGDIHDGEMKEVASGGGHFLVAKVAGQFYVTDGRCPHLGGRLAAGKLDGTVVTCPLHGSRFDLSDGRVVLWTNWTGVLLKVSETLRAPRGLNTYKPVIEGDKVFIYTGV